MKHRFEIVKHVPASQANVIANYLDLEHIPVHAGLNNCEVLTETDSSAVFLLTATVFGIKIKNVHYFEFRPPDVIVQIVKTPLGPMVVKARTTEYDAGTPNVRCEVLVQVEIDLPFWMWPLRRLLQKMLHRQDMKVCEEDMQIWKRRQEILGDYIEDYLHPDQRLLFKELFRKHYSRGNTEHPLARRT